MHGSAPMMDTIDSSLIVDSRRNALSLMRSQNLYICYQSAQVVSE